MLKDVSGVEDLWREPFYVVLEVENMDCRVLKTLASYGLENVKVVDVRASNRNVVKHLLSLEAGKLETLPFTPKRSRIIASTQESFWFESEGCEVCNAILSNEAFLISGKSIDGHRVVYSFIVPNFESYSRIIQTLENAKHHVNVLKVGKFERKAKVLTEKQERIFWLALKAGYFDYPRRISSEELAAKIGISQSTLSETLRRGTRRLLKNYFVQ